MCESIISITIRCYCNFDFVRERSIMLPSGAVEWYFSFGGCSYSLYVPSNGNSFMLFNSYDKVLFSYQTGEGKIHVSEFSEWNENFVMDLLNYIGVKFLKA